MKKFLGDVLHDFVLVFCAGAVLDVILFIVFFIVFWLTGGLAILIALTRVRAALLVVGGLLFLICAGLLMFGKGSGLCANRRWTKYFRRLDLFPVLFGTACFPIAAAIGLDYLIYYFI